MIELSTALFEKPFFDRCVLVYFDVFDHLTLCFVKMIFAICI